VDLNGFESVWPSENSNMAELEFRMLFGGPPMIGLTRVLRALVRRPTLTKLILGGVFRGRDDAREVGMVCVTLQA
jgi:hypothetical protein